MKQETNEASPAWLTTTVQKYCDLKKLPEAEAEEAFLANCQAAAARGLCLRQMRAERKGMGRVRVPLREYIEGIAARAGVLVAPFFEAYGVAQPPPPDEASARGLARLARMIGMNEEEVIAGIRLGFDPSWTEPMASLGRDETLQVDALRTGTGRGVSAAATAAIAAAQAVFQEPEI